MTPVLRSTSDGVARITLNRPDRMNAITVELARDLERAIVELGNDPAVNVIVISGANGNFCAGGDFDEVERLRANGPSALRTLFDAFGRACEVIGAVEAPVVAAVEGVATAGGFELMQAADIVLVSDEARIADSHIKFGMIPGGGSSQRLPRLVGRQTALGLLLSGDWLSGSDAERYGLAYRSFPQTEFDEGVTRFVADLANRQRQAVTAIKRLVYVADDNNLSGGLANEIRAVVDHIDQQGTTAFRRTEARR